MFRYFRTLSSEYIIQYVQGWDISVAVLFYNSRCVRVHFNQNYI